MNHLPKFGEYAFSLSCLLLPVVLSPICSAFQPLMSGSQDTVSKKHTKQHFRVDFPKTTWIDLLTLSCITLFVSLPMIRLGYPQVHDLGFKFTWLHQFVSQTAAGQLYPRWLETSFASLGSPTLLFYPPMMFWAALPFYFLGCSLGRQLIGSSVLAILISTVGAYKYISICIPQMRWIALVGALLTACSPYLLINLYVRGALAEAWAMAWIIWILWALQMVLESRNTTSILFLILGFSLLSLSHIPTLLLFSIVWISVPFIFSKSKQDLWRSIRLFYGSAILGVGLSCFFIFPVVANASHINLQVMRFAIPENRLIVSDILRLSPRLTNHHFDIQLISVFWTGIVVLLLCSSIFIFWNKRRVSLHHGYHVLFMLTILMLSSLMMTDLGIGVYRLFPILEKIQFSWRWMAVSNVAMTFTWCWVLFAITKSRLTWLSKRCLIYLVIITMVAIGLSAGFSSARFNAQYIHEIEMAFKHKPTFPTEEIDYPLTRFTNADNNYGLWKDSKGTLVLEDVSEYLPRWTELPTFPRDRSYQLVESDSALIEFNDIQWDYGFRQFQVNSPHASLLTLRMFAWHGWRVKVGQSLRDLQPQELMALPRDGRLQVRVPTGKSWVRVQYVGTKSEWMGIGISFTVVILLIAIGLDRPQGLWKSIFGK